MSKDTLSMFTHPSQTESSSVEPAQAALLRQVIGTGTVKHAEVRESSDEEDHHQDWTTDWPLRVQWSASWEVQHNLFSQPAREYIKGAPQPYAEI